ncbi:PilZ domain-containing protein [Qipengyuania vesicularis]|uniref:PilZ domain-containing protein n=1 Tax=Qipengyuania vesicularis TaxID=2867232 RepID=UPI001C882BEE|nr:PilZ domain-containing protein [Qipengyuania vesicularis]MBX7527341.1 PilZ domain-containing protein [Qipengyuania vesicularis]
MAAVEFKQRREERIDLFVRASVHSQPGAGVVRLCNMSPIGALIEGESLPLVGYEVELRRGSMCVPGKIVWRSGDQAGVSFSERTIVEDWFPDAQPQHSVDRAFQRIMDEMRERGPVRENNAPLHNSYITADDMHRVAGSLDDLADALSEDMEVVLRLSEELQTLDIAAQLLRKLAQQERARLG